MDEPELIYTAKEGIATVTLNRPQQSNALTASLQDAMHRAFDTADEDPEIKVIVLTGSGNAFCSGYDLGEADTRPGPRLDPRGQPLSEYLANWYRYDGARIGRWTHMWRIGKPIIAAVNGWALGQGFWYQLAADITIASERAVFGQPEVRHISNSSYLFTALCGWKAANRWALTGDHFDASEAYRIGMVNEVVSHAALMDAVGRLARRLALVPEPALRLNKAIAMQGIQAAGLHAGLLLEGTLGALAHASHDAFRLLARGRQPGDVDALAQLLARLSRFAVEQAGAFSSLELNPIMVLASGQGVVAVDIAVE